MDERRVGDRVTGSSTCFSGSGSQWRPWSTTIFGVVPPSLQQLSVVMRGPEVVLLRWSLDTTTTKIGLTMVESVES